MSQEKVDRYKASKTNRKQEVKKKKITKTLRITGASIILAAIVFWLGFSAYNNYQAKQPRPSVGADTTDIIDYAESLSLEE